MGADKESTMNMYTVGTDVQVVCLIATTVLIWDKPCIYMCGKLRGRPLLNAIWRYTVSFRPLLNYCSDAHTTKAVQWYKELSEHALPHLICLTHGDRLYVECEKESKHKEATPDDIKLATQKKVKVYYNAVLLDGLRIIIIVQITI